MVVIFYLSNQPAVQSDGLSSGIAEAMFKGIGSMFPGLDLDGLNHLVRKGAHFASYLMLGVLSMNALGMSGVRGLFRASVALAICVLYAASDEFHQLFVPGRSGEIRDVLIDSSGAALGISLCWLNGVRKNR